MGKRMERKEKELRGREEIHTLTQRGGGGHGGGRRYTEWKGRNYMYVLT